MTEKEHQAVKEFVLKYVVSETRSAAGRRLVDDYQLKREGRGWVAYWGMVGATTPVTSTDSMIEYARRSPLSYYVEKGYQRALDKLERGESFSAGRRR